MRRVAYALASRRVFSLFDGSDNLVWLSMALIVGPCAACGVYVISDFE